MNFRDAILDQLTMLAEPSSQLQYEKSLTEAGHAPSELVSVFCDDLYDPKNEAFFNEFTRDEHKDLAHLYGLIVEVAESRHASVSEMLKDPRWRRVVEVSQQVARTLRDAR